MTPPSSILHLISRLDAYGGARMLRYLASGQADCGANVAVAALSADPYVVCELRDAGVDVHSFHCRGPWDVVAQARLVRMATRSGVDLVHAWDARTLALIALGQSRRLASRYVATLGWSDAKRPWSRRIVRRARRRAACFAVSDASTQAWLVAAGVAADRVIAIPPGVAVPPTPTRSRADVLGDLSLPLDAPLIAVVSPLVRSQGLDETIWHFELLRVLHPSACLLFVGDGPDRARLERFAAQVSEPDAVRFLGFRNAHVELLAHVDAYWQLTASPTVPWALLEALAVGAPVVAADTPAHRAVVIPNKTGRLVPEGDRAAVTRVTDELLVNPELSQRLGKAAAEIMVSKWPLDRALDAYDQLYRRALVTAGMGVGEA